MYVYNDRKYREIDFERGREKLFIAMKHKKISFFIIDFLSKNDF